MTNIHAPNERYTGLIAGVSFIDGVGETEDKYLINWFIEKGYRVEKSDNLEKGIPQVEVEVRA